MERGKLSVIIITKLINFKHPLKLIVYECNFTLLGLIRLKFHRSPEKTLFVYVVSVWCGRKKTGLLVHPASQSQKTSFRRNKIISQKSHIMRRESRKLFKVNLIKVMII